MKIIKINRCIAFFCKFKFIRTWENENAVLQIGNCKLANINNVNVLQLLKMHNTCFSSQMTEQKLPLCYIL